MTLFCSVRPIVSSSPSSPSSSCRGGCKCARYSRKISQNLTHLHALALASPTLLPAHSFARGRRGRVWLEYFIFLRLGLAGRVLERGALLLFRDFITLELTERMGGPGKGGQRLRFVCRCDFPFHRIAEHRLERIPPISVHPSSLPSFLFTHTHTHHHHLLLWSFICSAKRDASGRGVVVGPPELVDDFT